MVHPHLRGEYNVGNASLDRLDGSPPPAWGILLAPAALAFEAGSPPPAWGIRAAAGLRGRLERFTPTCVGNTAGDGSHGHAATVHPHLRGEYGGVLVGIESKNGSPPPAWGIRIVEVLALEHTWFTPTCVGNTAGVFAAGGGFAVHPHLRGEYLRSRS